MGRGEVALRDAPHRGVTHHGGGGVPAGGAPRDREVAGEALGHARGGEAVGRQAPDGDATRLGRGHDPLGAVQGGVRCLGPQRGGQGAGGLRGVVDRDEAPTEATGVHVEARYPLVEGDP